MCKRVMVMEVPGKRRRGRTKRRWLDSIIENSQGRKRKTGINEGRYIMDAEELL